MWVLEKPEMVQVHFTLDLEDLRDHMNQDEINFGYLVKSGGEGT